MAWLVDSSITSFLEPQPDKLSDMSWRPFKIKLGEDLTGDEEAVNEFLKRFVSPQKQIAPGKDTMAPFMNLNDFELSSVKVSSSPEAASADVVIVKTSTIEDLKHPLGRSVPNWSVESSLQYLSSDEAACRIQKTWRRWRIQKEVMSIIAVRRIFRKPESLKN